MKETLCCIFCQIIKRSLPTFIVYEDQDTLAFLDHRPLFHGHCLLVPKEHYKTLHDLPNHILCPFFTKVQILSDAITEAMQAEGSFIAINNIVSQSVPHVHVHIVPRNKGDGLKGFFWPRHKYENESELKEVQNKIKKTLAKKL